MKICLSRWCFITSDGAVCLSKLRFFLLKNRFCLSKIHYLCFSSGIYEYVIGLSARLNIFFYELRVIGMLF